MLLDLVMIAGGLVALVLAGDALVKGAVNLSLRLGIPPLIVGLTVVAFGTSAPELIVSVQAVLSNVPSLALGNVVGSNTANILLVLGIPALIAAIPVARDLTRDYVIMLAASALFIGLAFTGSFGRWQALVLLGGLVLMLADCYLRAQRQRIGVDELEGAEPGMPGLKIAGFLLAGIVGLPFGAHFLVEGAVGVATVLGVSEAVIGLTLVAVGTSLPELATTVAAAIRREAGVALGNVLGSNVFNLLGIIGIAGLIGEIPVPAGMLRVDLWVMLGASALLGGFIWSRRDIGRAWGAVLLLLYATYVMVLFQA
ncbi:MAG: cation:H+ antiporter [Rhodobacteraceae bacterium HLUCCA12]|nr:MAG: cation:H+ antiporter [Rhodobacteraceae bacterium HLUCCA12]